MTIMWAESQAMERGFAKRFWEILPNFKQNLICAGEVVTETVFRLFVRFS